MLYAKLNSDKTQVAEWLEYNILPPHKAGYILPVETEEVPPHNPTTQYISEGNPTILSDKVIKTWIVNEIVIPVPDEIPLWAFRSSLVLNGLDGQVSTLIASLPEPQKTIANIQWEYGNFIVRSHPLIIAMAFQIGLTENQVNNVFITGSLLS